MIRDFYIGTYSEPGQPGILRVQADFERESLDVESSYDEAVNPSWVLLHPNGRVLYSVNELTPDGRVSVFEVSDSGRLTPVESCQSEGADPCHLSLDDSGRYLFAANYTSGSLAVLALDRGGMIVNMSDHKQHTGKGVHPIRQEGPHVHYSVYHDGLLYSTDLGLDQVFVYELDTGTGKLSEKRPFIELPAGSGPRHCLFSPAEPDVLYVLCELDSTLYVFRRQTDEHGTDEFSLAQRVSALPDDFTGESTAAAIHMSSDGRYLFTSNRGDDSIAAFRTGADGTVSRLGILKTGGRVPRDFALVEEEKIIWIVAANQETCDLTVLRFDKPDETLRLTDMRLCTGSKPVCLCEA